MALEKRERIPWYRIAQGEAGTAVEHLRRIRPLCNSEEADAIDLAIEMMEEAYRLGEFSTGAAGRP